MEICKRRVNMYDAVNQSKTPFITHVAPSTSTNLTMTFNNQLNTVHSQVSVYTLTQTCTSTHVALHLPLLHPKVQLLNTHIDTLKVKQCGNFPKPPQSYADFVVFVCVRVCARTRVCKSCPVVLCHTELNE